MKNNIGLEQLNHLGKEMGKVARQIEKQTLAKAFMKKKKSEFPIWLTLGIIAVSLAIGLAIVLLRDRNEDEGADALVLNGSHSEHQMADAGSGKKSGKETE